MSTSSRTPQKQGRSRLPGEHGSNVLFAPNGHRRQKGGPKKSREAKQQKPARAPTSGEQTKPRASTNSAFKLESP